MPAHLIAEEGPLQGSVLNLEEGQKWIIGRDADICSFVIEDSTVSRKHAELSQVNGQIYLKNLSSVNPTLLNDEEFLESVLLKEGDHVRIGSTVFLFSEEDIPGTKRSKASGGYDDIFGDLDTSSEEEEEGETAHEPSDEFQIPPAPLKPEMTAYDTIFEDVADDEIPFNPSSDFPFILKVIAGPNAGAEIGVEKGKSYTIGKDANSCDIIFQDLSVSRNHALLTVTNDGLLTIEDIGSKNKVAVNGEIIVDKTPISSQDLIALGTTVFVILDRDAPQDTIYSPVLAQHEEPPEEIEEEPAQEKIIDWKKRPIPVKYLVLAGSIAAVFLVVFLSFFSLFKPEKLEIAQKEPTSEIKKALDKFPDVEFSYSPGSGKLFLVGHVLTPVDYQEMNYRLSQIDFITKVEDTVIIDEGVWRMMNSILSENPAWRGISIHSPKAGRFVVSGYIQSIEEGAALYEYLTINFPYLDRLENHVIIEEMLNTEIQGVLAKENLGTVVFKLSNGDVVLSGNYAENMQKEMKILVETLHKIKGVSSIKNFAVPIHENRLGIDVSSNFEVTGSSSFDGKGFSVVLNGKIYTLGDNVEGMTITSIQPNTILLEKDGLRYKIDYTR